MQPDSEAQNDRKREEHLSKDGKWRSFPKAPHLLQYVGNANYYGRIKVGGKVIRGEPQDHGLDNSQAATDGLSQGAAGGSRPSRPAKIQ